MSTFTVSGRIEADAKALVSASREGAAALDQLKTSEAGAAAAAADLTRKTDEATQSQRRNTDETRRQTEQQRRQNEETKRSGDALALTKNQALQLRYTLSDVTASLSSGASPMTILLQQGPQLAQAFDNPRDALSKLGNLLTGTRGLVLGLGAAVATGVAAYESYAASVRQVNVALTLHGDRLGLTTAGYLALGRQIAETAGVSNREGREIVTALITSGARSKEIFDEAASAARGFGVAIGQDAADAAATLAEKLKTPGKSARELSEQFNLLDEATIRQIESMERSGDMLGAQARLAEALNGKFAALAGETSGWARAFEWLGNAASNAWDAVGNFLFGGPGGISGIDAQIAALQKLVDAPRASAADVGRAAGMGQEDLSAARTQLAVLQSIRSSWNAVADARAKADERAEASRRVGAIDARVNTEANAIQRLKDEEKFLRDYLARADISAGDRARAEGALTGVLKDQEEQRTKLNKTTLSADEKEAARLQERLALQRQDLDLLQQIVAARAAGDDATARKLQGQREAGKAGFDLSSSQGRDAASTAQQINSLQAVLKTFDDIEARMGRLSSNTPGASGFALKFDLQAARRWREESLANLDSTKQGYAEFADFIDIVFNDMVASAYDADLRRRTDWAAGVERAFRDLKRESQDFAATAERGIKDAAGSIKEEFISAALTGEASFERIGQAFGRMILEIAYQKLIASQVESALGWAVDGLSALFGLTSGGSGGGGSIPKTLTGVSKRHSGGFGYEPPTSFQSLPKFHSGGMAPDEIFAVLRKDEGVFTPRQMDNADQLITAIANRPIVVNMPSAAASSEPQVRITINGAPPGTEVQQRRNPDGSLDIDVMMDQMEDRMAGRIGQGRSPINTAIEQVYGGQRQVS